MKAMPMLHTTDPAKEIWQRVGDLKDIDIFGNYVLLGIYERPEQLKSGLYISDGTRKEDQYQGKSALVLKKGPNAFVSDDAYDFKGQNVEPGDWVAIFVSDGRKVVVRKQLCRLVEDVHIRMRVASPDCVY